MKKKCILNVFAIFMFALLVFSGSAGAAPAPVVTFPDPNLEAAIREAIGIGPDVDICRADLERLTTLHASRRGIVDLTGLEYAINLNRLYLIGNQIIDISPLSGLTSLTSLGLVGNQIIDISPLANLTSLTTLWLIGNQIDDISPLANLTSLVNLKLAFNQISDISPLANLTSLTTLWLIGNQIDDISPLANLTSLVNLKLVHNQISDISPLANLTSLTLLWLGDNRITDISPLSNLTSLTCLGLWGNRITDFTPLANLTSLIGLSLMDTHITNLTPLANLTSLTSLDLRRNEISDISPLSGLAELYAIFLDNNQIADISALSGLTKIGDGRGLYCSEHGVIHLSLSNNQIEDISPLVHNEGLSAGDGLNLRGNPLSNESLNTHIPQLQARGVNVFYDPTPVEQPAMRIIGAPVEVTIAPPTHGMLASVTIENYGTGVLYYHKTTDVNWIDIEGGGFEQTLPPGQSRVINIIIRRVVEGIALEPGTHTGTITFTGAGQTIDVPVILTVEALPVDMSVSPTSLSASLRWRTGWTEIGTISVTNPGGGTLIWNVTDNVDWMYLLPRSGTTTTETDKVTVEMTTRDLAVGTHTGTITFTGTGGIIIDVSVILTVTEEVAPAPESITISPLAAVLNIGETQQFTATVLPAGADQSVRWSTSDTAIGTIDADGLFTAHATGSVTVLASSVIDATIVRGRGVIVRPTPISITVSPLTATLSIGATQQFSATVLPVGTVGADQNVTWSVDNAAIGTIDADGVFTALAAGTVIVTARSVVDTTIVRTATVTVPEPIVNAGPDQVVFSGDVVSFVASIDDFDGTISFHWDFGDGTTAKGKTVSHRFRGMQGACRHYNVTLTVKDDRGNTWTDEVRVTVVPLRRSIETESFLLLPDPARLRVYYNWIDIADINGEPVDIYIISKVHFEPGGHISYFFTIWDHYSWAVPIPFWSYSVIWIPFIGIADRVFEYPFGTTHRDQTFTFNDKDFKGMVVGPSDTMRLWGITSCKVTKLPIISQVSAYFDPNLIEQPVVEAPNFKFAHLFSPGELRIYDYQGRVTGLVDGVVKQEIPYSRVDKETNSVIIFSPTGTFRHKVVGTEEGTYGLTIVSVTPEHAATFTVADIPITPKAVHQYTVCWVSLSQGWERSITVKIDSDGDGVFEETIVTTPPNIPSDLSPPHQATSVSASPVLSWMGGDPDGDSTTYRVYFGTDANPLLVSDQQLSTIFDPGRLAYNTKFYWRVVARDNHGMTTAGPMWTFTTISRPGVPPPDLAANGCFIATAAFGTPMAEEVEVLRRFRDEYLLSHELGRRFVAFYYRHSPDLARRISDKEGAKRLVRIALWPLVRMAEFMVGGEEGCRL